LESETSVPADDPQVDGELNASPHPWLRIGTVAAASAVLGGLAAAWFYRKTLKKLQDAQHQIPNSEFGAIADDSPEDF
jgi:hypothetical protein